MKKGTVLMVSFGLLYSTMLLGINVKTAEATELDTTVQTSKEVPIKSSEQAASVSTFSELKAAMNDDSITEIDLEADIQLTGTIISTVTNKTIYGNGHSIDAHLFHIKILGKNAQVTVQDLKISNTDIYGLFWSDSQDVVMKMKNIEHRGHQFIYLPYGELIIEGNFTAQSDLEEIFQGEKLTILPNAQVKFYGAGVYGTFTNAVSMLHDKAEMNIGKDANVTIFGTLKGIEGGTNFTLVNEGKLSVTGFKNEAIHLGAHSSVDTRGGSELHVASLYHLEEAIQLTSGSLFVRENSNFTAKNKSDKGTVVTGNQLVFEKGSNFSISNEDNDGKGVVFGSYIEKTNVDIQSNEGIKTWSLDNDDDYNPNTVYAGPLETQFTLSGYLHTVKQEMLLSSSEEFKTNYETGKVSKIVGGSYTNIGEQPPTLLWSPIHNHITEGETVVTGHGYPTAVVTLDITGKPRITTTVNDDGTWKMEIDPLPEGTEYNLSQLHEGSTSLAIKELVAAKDSRPTFDAVTTIDKKLTGTGKPGATIKITRFLVTVGTTTVSPDGTWSLDISPLPEGMELYASQTIEDKKGPTAYQIVIKK